MKLAVIFIITVSLLGGDASASTVLNSAVYLPMIQDACTLTAQETVQAGANAGMQALKTQRQAANEFESPILIAIHRTVEACGVPDANAKPSDPYNANVKAWYTDATGVDVDGIIEIGALGVIQGPARGIHIRINGLDAVAVIP